MSVPRYLLGDDITVGDHPWLLKPKKPDEEEEERQYEEVKEDEEDEEDGDEERTALRGLVQTLEAQLEVERSRRHEAEQETEATLEENGVLSQRLAALQHCQARQAELEVEVEELRQLWRAEVATSRKKVPDDVFISTDDQLGDGAVEEEEDEEKREGDEDDEEEDEDEEDEEERGAVKPRGRCQSEGAIQGASGAELRRRHRPTCARRPRALLNQRGVSLLSEVDAQYSALQRQYDELLRRCQLSASSNSNKAVQTPVGTASASQPPVNPYATAHAHAHAAAHTRRRLSSCASSEPPEYKALFMEIFNCIQKTKADLSDSSVHSIQMIQGSQSRRQSQPSQTDDTW